MAFNIDDTSKDKICFLGSIQEKSLFTIKELLVAKYEFAF